MLITEITHLIFTQSRMWRWIALKPTSTLFNCSLQGALPHRSPVVRWQSFLILEIEVSIFLSFLLQICSTFSNPGDQGLISIKFGITPTSIMNQNHPLLVKLKNLKNSVLTFIKGGKNLTVQFLISKRIWFLFWPLGFEVRKWVVTIIWFQVPRHPCPLPQLLQEWVWDETSERVKMLILARVSIGQSFYWESQDADLTNSCFLLVSQLLSFSSSSPSTLEHLVYCFLCSISWILFEKLTTFPDFLFSSRTSPPAYFCVPYCILLCRLLQSF